MFKWHNLLAFLGILELYIPSTISDKKDAKFLERKYQYFSENDRLQSREDARRMFYYGYNNYMEHAFPMDELDPIHCRGRGPDLENP